MISRFLRFIMI